MLKELESQFRDLVYGKHNYVTLGTLNFTMLKVKKGKKWQVPKNVQSKYQSGMGIFLYFVKHSQPDIANTIHELFKAIDSAN